MWVMPCRAKAETPSMQGVGFKHLENLFFGHHMYLFSCQYNTLFQIGSFGTIWLLPRTTTDLYEPEGKDMALLLYVVESCGPCIHRFLGREYRRE